MPKEPSIYSKERMVSSKYGVGKTGQSTCRKMKLDPYLTPLIKINLKWIKDLNISFKTIKLLEENVKKKFLDVGLGNDFLDMIPKTQATKAKINRWECMNLKNFHTAKETINKMKS